MIVVPASWLIVSVYVCSGVSMSIVVTLSKNVETSAFLSATFTLIAFAPFPVFSNLCTVEIPVKTIC